jgi:hypothetical protein
MIDATERKLREAQFFLERLVTESTKPVRNDPEAFGFYLSALLSAARSVTFALQYEEKEKYDAWFPEWFAKLSSDDQKFFKFLKEQRNVELHQGGSELEVVYEYVAVSRVQTHDHPVHPAYGFSWSAPPGVPEPMVGIPKHRFEAVAGQRDVVAACRKYITGLTDLVKDFVAAHKM